MPDSEVDGDKSAHVVHHLSAQDVTIDMAAFLTPEKVSDAVLTKQVEATREGESQ
jgi:hypothetical protein